MNDQDYKFFEDLLRKKSGLVITLEKMYLLRVRLQPLVQKHGIQGGLDGLAQKLRQTPNAELQRAIVEAMATNETSFFRDIIPFQRLREDLLPCFAKSRAAKKTLRILSAACSSGQEPYTIAMVLKEYPQFADWKFEIVAIDLSQEILAQAKAGIYSQFEIQRGLPVQMLIKYFIRQGDCWAIKPEIRDMVSFRAFNLLADLSSLGQFDIIFCRNVLIYFDLPTKAKVLTAIKGLTRQDSILFLGGAETVMGVSDAFKPLSDIKGVYVRSDTTFSAAQR